MKKLKYILLIVIINITALFSSSQAITIYFSDSFTKEDIDTVKGLVNKYLKIYRKNEILKVKKIASENTMDDESLFDELKGLKEKIVISINIDRENSVYVIGVTNIKNNNVSATCVKQTNENNRYYSILDCILYMFYKFGLIKSEERML